MAEPTLSEIFGANASQDATTITIEKADLAAVGLTATATNTAESLLAAIVLRAKDSLKLETFDTNADQSITIESGFNSIVQKTDPNGNATEYRQFQYNIGFHKLSNETISPDDL